MSLIQIRTPSSVDPRDPATAARSDLHSALEAVVRGEVRFSDGDRGAYSTDASNYRQVPIGVVLPKDAEDVAAAMAICRSFDAPVLGRGGGTSLAGQCCNEAVVFDYSKYMNRVLEVDPVGRRAVVQPGLILDHLRHETERHGLTFGPDPSTHDRCTLGGMMGNNACGIHAVLSEFYGPGPRTEDNVESLEILTYDGLRMRVGPTSDALLRTILNEGGRKAQIHRDLLELRERYADLIRTAFPDIPRRVSGYNLPALLPENGFDVAKALVGTESTCVSILEGTVKLSPALNHRVLVVVGYPTVYEAGDDVMYVREFRPVGCEGIDRKLIDYMYEKQVHAADLYLLPRGDGWLFVEFGGDTKDEAADQAHAFARSMRGRPGVVDVKILLDEDQQDRFWEIRESGLGATAFVPGRPDFWPGWEDAAVAPEAVGPYLRQFRELMRRYGYEAALYGHFAQGCIHCRINFDLASETGIRKYRAFTDEAADLVLHHGGSISGEHGDGQSRGDLLPKMYGPELMEAFRAFKQIWDPMGKMNPGKVIDARSRTEDLKLGTDYRPMRAEPHFRFPEDNGDFTHAALRCVGVGKCRRHEHGVMCPSYMVTHDEKHTTRGRSRLLFEMVRNEGAVQGWKSDEVFDALDLCLSCKGCKSDCPVHVDMATYKAEFLSHYYKGKVRPRYAYAFGLIHKWARLAENMPTLANWVSSAKGLSALFKKLTGTHPKRSIPQFAEQTFVDWFRARERTPNPEGPRVILWPDTFNNFFFPRTLVAATEVLEHAGCRVQLPQGKLCCGRPLYDYGFLDQAKRQFVQILHSLHRRVDEGTPVVGVEPSCVAAFRDELVNLDLGERLEPLARRLSENTFTLAEYLVLKRPDYHPPRLQAEAIVQRHCHHHAILGHDCEHALMQKMGLNYEMLDSGCCGMAGAFGYEHDKYDVSVACGERVVLPRVREADPSTLVIADGFSCREQIQQGTNRAALHLAEVMQLALHRADVAPELRPEEQIQSLYQPSDGPGLRAAMATAGATAVILAAVVALLQ